MGKSSILDMIKQVGREGKGFGEIIRRGGLYVLRRLLYPYAVIKILIGDIKGSEKATEFIFSISGGLIRPMQLKSEILQLLNEVEKIKPKKILEIGTANGGTLFSICRSSPKDAKIISIDLPRGKFGGGYANWRKWLYKLFVIGKQKIYFIRNDSHSKQTLEEVEKLLNGGKIDFLFIDGDHTYEGVKRDFNIYSKIVRDGGLIAFHDIARTENDSKVYEFWEEIKKLYNNKEFINNECQGWAGIGIIRK
jgi:predicted O-methyltransferase YrrM